MVQAWSIAGIAFIGGVGGGVVFPILPVIGMQLGLSGFMVGLILSANRITRLFFNAPIGSLVDRFGARWPVAGGLALEALGTLAYSAGLSSQMHAAWFLLGRIVWGVGSSLLLVGTLAAVMAVAPAARRGGMTARVRTAISLGLPAGLVIGGLVADRVSANAAFVTATILSVLGALAALKVMPREAKVDRVSTEADADTARPGWRQLFRIHALPLIWGANALLFFAMSGVLLATLAILVKQRGIYLFGLGAEGSAGLFMAVMMTARASASLASGRHLDRSRSRTRLLMPSVLMVAAGFGLMAWSGQVLTLVLSLLLVGAGSAGLTIPMLTLLGDVSPPGLHGRALSVYQWSSDFGGALGPAAGLEMGRLLGYHVTYCLVGAAMLGMAWPLWRLKRRHRHGPARE